MHDNIVSNTLKAMTYEGLHDRWHDYRPKLVCLSWNPHNSYGIWQVWWLKDSVPASDWLDDTWMIENVEYHGMNTVYCNIQHLLCSIKPKLGRSWPQWNCWCTSNYFSCVSNVMKFLPMNKGSVQSLRLMVAKPIHWWNRNGRPGWMTFWSAGY